MKTTFLKPRYVGGRFEEHTLPVEIAKDLLYYEKLIIELAKHLYKNDHPGRVRVPSGFDQQFNLHFEGAIEPGSAKTTLACVVAGALALAPMDDTVYFSRARDMLTDVIARQAAAQPLPAGFPSQLLSYFNGFGRSLRGGEEMEIPRENGAQPARLNPEIRKALVLRTKETYTKDILERGNVEEIDTLTKTFRYRTRDNRELKFTYTKDSLEKITKALGNERMWVEIAGIGTFTVTEEQRETASVHELELLPNQELVGPLEDLLDLQVGWLEPDSEIPTSALINDLITRLGDKYPADLIFPYVAPLPAGGIYLEWITPDYRTSAEILNGTAVAHVHSTRLSTTQSIEQQFDLNNDQQLTDLYALLHTRGCTLDT